jgi:hypothetical protein
MIANKFGEDPSFIVKPIDYWKLRPVDEGILFG